MIISSIVNRNKLNHNTLCGIWLYHGPENKPNFSWAKFDILGIANDTRGGDACGRYTANSIEHANSTKDQDYRDYIKLNYPPTLKKNSNTVIGHSRKSSAFYGSNSSLEHTQPIVRWNENSNEIKKTLVHNGTIYNTDFLIKKYGVSETFRYRYINNDNNFEFKDFKTNDSNALADILFNIEGYEVLKDYQGTASLAWYDKDQDLLYLFAGESLTYASSSKPTEERPLFFRYSDNYVWVSSLEAPLLQTRDKKDCGVEEVPKNNVLIFKSGKLIDSIPIDRSNSSQAQHFSTHTKNSRSNDRDYYYGYNNSFDDEDYYDDTCSMGGDNRMSPLSLPEKTNNQDFYSGHRIIYKGKDKCNECKGTGESLIILNTRCGKCKGTGQIQKVVNISNYNKINTSNGEFTEDEIKELGELLTEDNGRKPEKLIKFARLRYWWKKELLHGIYHISKSGEIHRNKILDEKYPNKNTKVFYFIKGIMIETDDENKTNHQIWNNLSRKVNKSNKLEWEILEEICHHSQYPISSLTSELAICEDEDSPKDWGLFTGKVYALFSRECYEFEDGVMKNKKISPNGLNSPIIEVEKVKKEKQLKINLEEEENETSLNDSYKEDDDAYEDLVKKEVELELMNFLRATQDAKNALTAYFDHKIGLRAHEFLSKIENQIENSDEFLDSDSPF
jgi:hypothetical protein